MSIKAKFIGVFTIIVIAIVGLVFYVTSSIGEVSTGFKNYREMAKDSVLAGRIQANVLKMRLSVLYYLKDINKLRIDEFEKTTQIQKSFQTKH